jgi:UDP-glucose 4-epimerase
MINMEIDVDLKQQRCLVLGGSGFIGTNLCLALRSAALSVRAFSTHSLDLAGIEWVEGDFLDGDALDAAVRDIDVVYHLISTTTPAVSNENPIMDAQQNILQTLQLLELCVAHKVKKVVFVSSGGTVYGDAKLLPTPETAPTDPICGYGVSKLSIEKYLSIYERLYGLKSITLRVSNPYGPFQYARKQQGVIGAFIEKALTGRQIEIWGNGTVVRDYIFIDDVVSALMKAVEYHGTQRIFNVGTGVGINLNDIVDALSLHLIKPLDVIYMRSRNVDVSKSVLDCSLALREMKWSATHDLETGIGKTLAWFRENS